MDLSFQFVFEGAIMRWMRLHIAELGLKLTVLHR